MGDKIKKRGTWSLFLADGQNYCQNASGTLELGWRRRELKFDMLIFDTLTSRTLIITPAITLDLCYYPGKFSLF